MRKTLLAMIILSLMTGLFALAGCGSTQTKGAKTSDLKLSEYVQYDLKKHDGAITIVDWKQFGGNSNVKVDDHLRMTSDGRFTLRLPSGLANISAGGIWKVDDKTNSIIFTGDDGRVVTLPMKKTILKTEVGYRGTFLEWKAVLPDKNAYVSFGQEEVK